MKNYELVSILRGLEKVTNLETELPVSIGYKIVQNKKTIEKLLEPFEEMKENIIKKYADKDNEVKHDNPHYKDCVIELNELSNQEVEDFEVKKVSLSSIENYDLPISAIKAIGFMIEE